MKNLLQRSIVLAAILAIGTTAWAGTFGTQPKTRPEVAPQTVSNSSKNIVERLEGMGNFSILLTALETASLKDTVATGGPFTLFAPTDQAFAELLNQLNITPPELLADPRLTSILLYHVAPGRLRTGGLVGSSTQSTLSDGKSVLALLEGTDVLVNPNVKTPNGIIHTIDTVLLP